MTFTTIIENPAVQYAVTALGTAILSWGISWFASPAETAAEQSRPFFAGLMTFLRGAGFDPPKVLAGLRDMWLASRGKHPAQLAAKAARANERGASIAEGVFTLSIGTAVLYAAACIYLNACSGVKIDPKFIGKTIEEIAYEACSLFAEDQAPILNQSVESTVKQLCGTADLIKPFIDDILASKKKASLKFAASHPVSDAGSMPASQ